MKKMKLRSVNKLYLLTNGLIECKLIAESERSTLSVIFTDENVKNYRDTGRVSKKKERVYEVINKSLQPFQPGQEVQVEIIHTENGWYGKVISFL